MKKILISLLLVLLLAGQVFAGGQIMVMKKKAAGATCQASPFYDSTGTVSANYLSAGQDATNFYAGYQSYNPAATKTVCKIELVLTCPYGSCASYTYYAAAYTMSGTNMGTLQGAASNGVTGNNSWADTTVSFTMGTMPTLSNGTNYIIVVYNNTQGGNQLVRVKMKDNNGYKVGQWGSNLTRVDGLSDREVQMKLYAYE